MKLIETAIDNQGNSYIYSQTTPQGWELPGHIITDLFFSEKLPSSMLDSGDTLTDRHFNLKPGQLRFFRSDIYPTRPVYEQLADTDKGSFEQLFYHSTTTVDYIMVLKGELVLIVGEQKVALKAGDCIVQRGAAHAWHNYTDEVATIMGIMIGVEPPAQFNQVDTVQPD